MTNTLEITVQNRVAKVFLNRPEVRNAFNDGVISELAETFTRLGQDPGVRVIVLGGHGKAFCAGADLNWMKSMAGYGWEDNRADATRLAEMLWAIYSCPLPVVGRLHGDCYAGGMGLAACCDVLVASREMHFCLSEARIGLIPATIGPYVIRALGEQAARRYFITGEKFDAVRARDLGFVHEVVQTDQLNFQSDSSLLDSKVNEIVATLLANGPGAVKACKRLVKDVAGREITPELRAETARRIADIRASEEGREGVQAFLNKREPGWK